MANNPYKNKIVYNGTTLIDLTGDTITAADLAQGITAHDASGAPIVGTATGGGGSAVSVVDTTDTAGGTIRTITAVSLAGDTVAPSNLLTGYTAHNALGEAIVGTATGGGGVDMPTFTMSFDDQTGDAIVTCDKTYAECYEYITDGGTFSAVLEVEDVPVLYIGINGTILFDQNENVFLRYLGYDSTSPAAQIDYMSDGTITYSDIPSDLYSTLTVTQNGTYEAPYGTLYSEVDVNVPSSQPVLQAKTNINPTTSSQTIQPDSGYDGLSSVQINAMPSGSATAPATISGTSATVSTGTNTLTLSKTVSVTPSVTAGYVSSGTAGNSNVSLTASVTTQAAQTIYPSSSDQSIASGRYLTGAQTIKGVTTTNLTADNIKSGVTVQVGDSADSDRVLSVTGTYSGGGGSSDIATGTLTVASNVNTSTSTTIATTTTIGFTPTKFFFYKTERTATSNHVHQATFTTLGSNYIRTMTRYSSNALSTSGNTNNWTTQTAGYLYYNSNTVYFRSSSSYILSAGTWNWVAVK